MPGPRQTTDAIKARGRKHLSKREETERRAGEVKLDTPKFLSCPKWLDEAAAEQFRTLQRMLCDAGLASKLDADMLAAYCVHYQSWKTAAAEASVRLEQLDLEGADGWSRIQERYFKQARNAANDLGLTVTSRCRLVLPPKQEDEADEFTQLLQRRRASEAG